MLTETNPGWKIYLPDRERVISRPVAIGGLLDFLAYKPDADPCAYGGGTYLYSVNYATGQAPARIAIHSPEITTGTSGNVTVRNNVLLGIGAPPAADAIIVQRPQNKDGGGVQKNIQLSTGAIAEAKNEPLFSIASKIMHWLKK
jgi:type IV pilus assembly protein PilY1